MLEMFLKGKSQNRLFFFCEKLREHIKFDILSFVRNKKRAKKKENKMKRIVYYNADGDLGEEYSEVDWSMMRFL